MSSENRNEGDSAEKSPQKSFEQHFPHTAARLASQSRDEGTIPPPLSLSDAEDEPDSMAASKRLEERLSRAAQRREAMLEERRIVLAAQEEQRREKQGYSQMRKEALQAFILKAPAIFSVFKRAGLMTREGAVAATPEEIEQVLMMDPRCCDKCTGTADEQKATCPATKKPHRRSLVTYAEQLLRLIGNARVNLAPSKFPSEQQPVDTTPVKGTGSVARRGISIHPHLLC